jgi:outer membrane protein assembly factor BamB
MSSAPKTNQTLWNYTTGSYVVSSPAVVGGFVYAGSVLDHKVYALNAATGAFVWSYTTGMIVGSSPAVVGGVVYVGSYDYKVYALNAATGAFIWSYTTGGVVQSSPAVADGKVYVGSLDYKVYALNATTHTLAWSYTTGKEVRSSPAVVGGVVYVGSDDYKVYALNAATGALIWNYTTGGAVWTSSPAVADGKVYVGSYDGKVYCLNASTGAHIWNYTTDYQVSSSPAVADGKVYVGSYDNKVYCLDALTGASIWNYTTGNYVHSSPAVADGKVYVGSHDNKTYCLNATTGSLIWRYTTGGIVSSSPAVVGGVVYVGSQDMQIYAFGKHVNVWGIHIQEPAPMGIVDYGIGPNGPYEYTTNGFMGIATIASLSTNNSVLNETWMSFQLNVNLAFATNDGPYVYWIQDIAQIDTSNNAVWFLANIWNGSAPSANMSNSGVSGNGNVSTNKIYYAYRPNPQNFNGTGILLTYPATITFNVTAGISSSGEPTVSFAYDDGYGLITYDTVTFNGTNLTSFTGFEVNGVDYTPRGNYYDSELILGGVSSGRSTTDLQSDVRLQLEYWNGHNYQIVPNAYNFGSDTGEYIDNVLSGFSSSPWRNGEIFAEILPGAGQLGELYNQSQTGTIDIISPLASGTLNVSCGFSPGLLPWQIPFVSGEVNVILYNNAGFYHLRLYNQYGELYDQGYFMVSPGQILHLQAPFSRPAAHNIAAVSAASARNVIGKSFGVNVTVLVADKGDYTETFTVTIYANSTVIGTTQVSLNATDRTTLTLTGDTSSLAKGNYTISAVADTVAGEIDTTDNNCTVGTVTVTVPGDVTGEGKCDMQDISIMIDWFMTSPPNWDPNCDVDNDLNINMVDISIAIDHFMQT